MTQILLKMDVCVTVEGLFYIYKILNNRYLRYILHLIFSEWNLQN